MKDKKKQIDWGKVGLMVFCALLVILIFRSFLIPAVLGMVGILLKLVVLYKSLEMPYLFFGSVFFLFISWYFFNIFCNFTYRLIKFVFTTSVYKIEKKNDSKGEIREGAYCTQCGKYIPEGEHFSREGHIIRSFFGLFEKDNWEHYFCSDKCDRKFCKSYKIKSKKGKNKK